MPARQILSILMPHAPREQFSDPVDRMVGDAGENVAKIGFGIETVELCGLDERQDRRGTLAALVRSGEQPILSLMQMWRPG